MKEHRSQLQPRALTLMVTFQTAQEVRIQMDRGVLMECLNSITLPTVCSAAYTVCSKHRCFLQEEKNHLHAEKCIVIKHFKRGNVLENLYYMANTVSMAPVLIIACMNTCCCSVPVKLLNSVL